MAIRPSVPEIITVNSEELQTQIRDLLPSQNGFGSELQATNVITPIIDLTAAAAGQTVPNDLSQALAFGSQTGFSVVNTSSVLINTTGFYRVFGQATLFRSSTAATSCSFTMSDGLSTKGIWAMDMPNVAPTAAFVTQNYDFIVFLAAGESLTATSSDANANMNGTTRQIATGDGTIVLPNGFPV